MGHQGGAYMKQRDFSLPGAILIVASQLFSSFQSSDQISKEIVRFREEFHQSIIYRDTYFVRKEELAVISKKIDTLNSRIVKIAKQIDGFKRDAYAYSDEDSEIVGCRYKQLGM
jgi:hypothetical protein